MSNALQPLLLTVGLVGIVIYLALCVKRGPVK